MNKKKIFSLAVVAIMIAILSMSSLAWFSDRDEIKNDFLIADSDDDTADRIFSVDVWENTPDSNNNQDNYTYENILPGAVLKKEAVVENTGYYDQYIRVTVTVSKADAWMAVLNTTDVPDLGQIVNGLDMGDTWYADGDAGVLDEESNSLVYTLYYRNILLGDIENDNDKAPNANRVTVFTQVKIPASMTVQQAVAFDNDFSITVKADAVQTENLGIDTTNGYAADDAFAVVEG